MSYVFPCSGAFNNERTQPVNMNVILSGIENWALNNNAGISNAPTYKSNNNVAAYFRFMKIQDRKLNEFHAFCSNPDQPMYNDIRKYMIVVANILLSEFNDKMKLGAREIDYSQICRLTNQPDLEIAFKKWAAEIDPQTPNKFTEIYAVISDVKYPVAFYSNSGMRIYPYNTINKAVSSNFIGWDENFKDGLNNYTMEAFKKGLDKIPLGARMLYAVLDDQKANLKSANMTKALSAWLAKNYMVVDPVTGEPMKLAGTPTELIVDNTSTVLNIPIYPPPYAIGTDSVPIFSDRLLIIKSNKNVEDNKYGFCVLNNAAIGKPAGEHYAVVPPISQDLIHVILNNTNDVEFAGCEVERRNNGYFVTVKLSINGAKCDYSKTYPAGNVSQCANFPLIAVLSQKADKPFPAQLYRCNYPATEDVPRSFLDGEDVNFEIGLSPRIQSDGFELAFNQQLIPVTSPDSFRYFGVRYRDNTTGNVILFGYLFFDTKNSLFQTATTASSTAVIIDDENNVAKIAVWDTTTGEVASYDVYNDKVLFFTNNKRPDLNATTGKIWGIPNHTIFSVENDTKYALAPFSLEFSKMLAEGTVSISQATFEAVGDKWTFAVKFIDNGGHMQQAPVKVYEKKNQYLCPNPPFISAVSTVEEVSASPGYEIVLVQNMKPNRNSNRSVQTVLDSNEMVFKIDRKELNPSHFIRKKNEVDQRAYIQIYGGQDKSVYYGQIGLPINDYLWNIGFNPNLRDEETGCAAVLLVNDKGQNQPKEIITGRVFDDNILFVVVDESRENESEYKSWERSGLFVNIKNMPANHHEGKTYKAIFPFSLKMLQNLKNGTLKLAQGTVPSVVYDMDNKCYDVMVSIDNGGGIVEFKMKYHEDKITKCDNLPFIIPFINEKAERYIVRFDNELSTAPSINVVDGSAMITECVDGNIVKEIPKSTASNSEIVQVDNPDVVIKLNVSGITCHVLYKMPNANDNDVFKEGVYSVKSSITGTQHVFDFYSNNTETGVKEIKVFTDYMMWTNVETRGIKFANNADLLKIGQGTKVEEFLPSIPITMEFSRLMEERGISISSYANVRYYTDINNPDAGISDSSIKNGLYVDISLTGLRGSSSNVVKKYSADNVFKFTDFPLPTLTVFPFVNFVADNSYGSDIAGKSLWHEYSYARFVKPQHMPKEQTKTTRKEPLGSRVEFWINGKFVDFNDRSTLIMEKSKEEDSKYVMGIAKVNGWGTYIHMKYDGSSNLAANLPIDSKLNGQELGCIMMHPAEKTPVSADQTAVVGVDFGTRNSIISIRTPSTGYTFPYHGKVKQKVIVPGMADVTFNTFSNLSYIPQFDARGNMNSGEGKFSSTVMLYSAAQRQSNIPLTPYDWGFVPNVQGDVLRRIMNGLEEKNGDMGSVLGFYSDLKISTSDDDQFKKDIMQRNVRLFIKSIIFHIVLNCYQEACGKMDIRISVPSKQFIDDMSGVWKEAKEYIEQAIPAQARGNIKIGAYTTEAKALFKYLQEMLANNPNFFIPKYSAITDGGDGTYDFTINKLEGKNFTNPKSFSLRYAGQQIMTDSINAFYDHLVYLNNGVHSQEVKSVFKGLWNNSGKEQDNLNALVEQISICHSKGSIDRETEKTLVLMLIEQFGINCKALINPTHKNFMDISNPKYQNFIRMIQYKFLFLFNILGEQLKDIHFENEVETSFMIFLYGGTAQALAIVEPMCNGNIQSYTKGANFPMVKFITAMMNLPKNKNNQPIVVKFMPALDTEKREIASGLIMTSDNDMDNYMAFQSANPVVSSNMEMPAPDSSDNGLSGVFGSNPFGGSPFGDVFGSGKSDSISSGSGKNSNSKMPATVDEFIADLKNILNNRKIELPQGWYSIDNFLPFLDKAGKPINLSKILDDPYVRNQLSGQLVTMWTNTVLENQDIEESSDLIYNIYTLKMVGFAIETYLKQ